MAWILVPEQDASMRMLFIKRAAHPKDPWSGHMALPGGRRDAVDEDLVATAMRETLEETGVRLERGQLLGQLDDLAPQNPLLPRIVVRPYVFLLREQPVVTASVEVSRHVWFPLEGLDTVQQEATVRVLGVDRRVPAYLVDGDVVWGMTYQIVSSALTNQRD